MTGKSLLEQLAGKRVRGGCPDCDAYTDYVKRGRGIFVARIQHDVTCPLLRKMRNGGGSGA